MQFRTEFLKEIDFMKNLGYHSHLVNMVGCISDPKKPMLLMEFCGNGDLLRFLREPIKRLLQVENVVIEPYFDMHIFLKESQIVYCHFHRTKKHFILF
jgi:serine/threonine protein kinase